MSNLSCPNCQGEMAEVQEPDMKIDRCGECGGVFLDRSELNALATGMKGDIEFCSIDKEAHSDAFTIRSCPRCGDQEMRKINLLAYSDTIFDFCPECEGFYLDKGESAAMNAELAYLTKDERADEYRGYREGHMVRLDSIQNVMTVQALISPTLKPMGYPQQVFFLRLSVYFEKALGLGLRIGSEKWTDRISRLIGLSKQQDIRTGDPDLDKAFVIQGNGEERITDLLSREELKRQLLEFNSNKPTMLGTAGKLEITDKRILLTEGPYTGSGGYEVEKDPKGLVSKMLGLALLFEKT